MKIELSNTELEMIKRALSDHISDYCVGDEDRPYLALLKRLENISKRRRENGN